MRTGTRPEEALTLRYVFPDMKDGFPRPLCGLVAYLFLRFQRECRSEAGEPTLLSELGSG